MLTKTRIQNINTALILFMASCFMFIALLLLDSHVERQVELTIDKKFQVMPKDVLKELHDLKRELGIPPVVK